MGQPGNEEVIAADERRLAGLGYKQELRRGMGAFSNYALSLSIICILAGGVTSFHQGLSSVGGAAFGLGWPLVCLFSLAVAATGRLWMLMCAHASFDLTAYAMIFWSLESRVAHLVFR